MVSRAKADPSVGLVMSRCRRADANAGWAVRTPRAKPHVVLKVPVWVGVYVDVDGVYSLWRHPRVIGLWAEGARRYLKVGEGER